MDISELQNDLVVIEFFDMMQFAKATEKNYLMTLRHYTDYMNKSPSDLIEGARKEIRSGRMLSERSVKKHLLGFRKYMSDKNMAPLSIKMRMSNVISFYKFFDVEVPRIPTAKAKARTLECNNNIPTKDDIQEVQKYSNVRDKAIMLVGCSSGLSSNEIIRLTVKQFKEGYDSETGITIIKMRRAKTDVDFITFLSPEASQAVLDYLKWRNRPCNSRFPNVKQQQEKQRVFDDSNYLFIKDRVPIEYSKKHDEKLRQLTPHSVVMLYQRLANKSGYVSNEGWNLIRSHNMRKLFCTTLKNEGMDSERVEFMMGHYLGDTKSAYFLPNPEKLRDIYIKFVQSLTIQPSVDVETSPEYQQIVKEKNEAEVATGRIALKADRATERADKTEEAVTLLEERVKQLEADKEILRNLWDMDVFARKMLKEMGYIK